MSTPLHFALLLGSIRHNNNGKGITQWVKSHLETIAPGSKVSIYDPVTPPLPLGPLDYEYMTMGVVGEQLQDGTMEFPYANEKVKEWSGTVQGFDAVIIITPQYNRGYPGEWSTR